jgi:ABC-type amino acid transport substrate-binding protein
MKIAQNKTNKKSNIAITIAIIAILFSISNVFINNRSNIASIDGQSIKPIPTLLDKVDKTGELHVGYGVYPPYTIEDPNTQEVSGFSVDIINQIAKELNVKIVWHRLNWNTMSADLKRGEFDVIADPIFQTIPRAREFSFTEPYAYFSDGIAVVRKNDNRFQRFEDLDRKDIKIAVGQGWASETIVKSKLTKPEIIAIQTNTDLLQLFNEVQSGRVDVAIADGADAKRFVDEHPESVKALWLDNPPAHIPAGFALRPSDRYSAEFLTVCIRNLKYMGVIDGLAEKYKVSNIADEKNK